MKMTDENEILVASLSRSAEMKNFAFWIIGDTPLITHAWSEKARRQMLESQVGAVKPGKEKRVPQEDFVNSLYNIGEGIYGFPAMGIKNALLSCSHKDKGIPKTVVMASIWIDANMVRVRAALAGAICDMPLLRIYGDVPEMREDMVRIGGITKMANLAYRGQFKRWAIKVIGRVNTSVVSIQKLAYLVTEAGISSGLGEWRNERKGVFGAFSMASDDQVKNLEALANGEISVDEAFA
jgi:hypothetical protein